MARRPFCSDGRILGMKVETLGNVGAYLSNTASAGPTMAGSYGTGTYNIENFEAVAKVVLTILCRSTRIAAMDAQRPPTLPNGRAKRWPAISVSIRLWCGGSISSRHPIFRIALAAAVRDL
jgi:Molybdopterin-binding domain of aldehyde dehydrogenase